MLQECSHNQEFCLILNYMQETIKKMTNENATLSDDKKTVTLEVSFENVKKKNVLYKR